MRTDILFHLIIRSLVPFPVGWRWMNKQSYFIRVTCPSRSECPVCQSVVASCLSGVCGYEVRFLSYAVVHPGREMPDDHKSSA